MEDFKKQKHEKIITAAVRAWKKIQENVFARNHTRIVLFYFFFLSP